MKYFKKSIIFFLVMALILGSVPLVALANENSFDFNDGTLGYKITSVNDKTVAVAGLINSEAKEIKIPEQVKYNSEMYAVTSIASFAFAECDSITSVEMTDSIETIDDGAFQECYQLTSIQLSNKLTTISPVTFNGCASLPSLNIPNSVTNIEDGAFASCDQLSTITLGEGVSYIGAEVFDGDFSLTEINVNGDNPNYCSLDGFLCDKQDENNLILLCCPAGKSGDIAIPGGIKTIGFQAFDECVQITTIEIGTDVTSMEVIEEDIGEAEEGTEEDINEVEENLEEDTPSVAGNMTNPFLGCDSLTTIKVNEENEVFKSIDGVLYDKELNTKKPNTLLCYPAGREGSFTIPDGITAIGDYAFSECHYLTSVTIGKDVTNIGYIAFLGCILLNAIIIPNKDVTIGEVALGGCPDLIVFSPSGGSVENYVENYAKNYDPGNEIPFQDLQQAGTDTLINLEITTKPNKYKYTYDEIDEQSFDPTGMVIKANYYPKSNKTIYNGKGNLGSNFVVEFCNNDTPRFTLTYKDRKVSFFVIVKNSNVITSDADTYSKTVGDDNFNLKCKATSVSEDSTGIIIYAKSTLLYESDNTNVVTVNSSGDVTIVGAGNATITVTATEDDEYYSATKDITITVNKKQQAITATDSYTKTIGDANFNLNCKANSDLTYESNNNGVVTVNSSGVVTIVGVGNATITVTVAEDNTYYSATKDITIKIKEKEKTKDEDKDIDNNAPDSNQNISVVATVKKGQTITAKSLKKTYKAKKLKKKAKSFTISASVNSNTPLSYKKIAGNKKIAVRKNGKVTVKKGLKKGTYKIKIGIYATGNAEYNPANKIITITVKIK